MPEELDASRVKGILDSAVNVELQRHMLQPGGTAAGDIRFFCECCQKALAIDDLLPHLNKAALRALTRQ
jgi:hypothetical protein